MQSKKPVFARSEGFNGRGGAATTSPASWQINLDGSTTGQGSTPGLVDDDRMSVASVDRKSVV